MPILLAGTIEFVHIEQVSALFMFCLGQVLLYNYYISLIINKRSKQRVPAVPAAKQHFLGKWLSAFAGNCQASSPGPISLRSEHPIHEDGC
jgi:hypothetical protein